jgi:hypothetical protein
MYCLLNLTNKADIDSVDTAICACGSPMLMTFFYVNARGLQERTESRGRSREDGVDPERRKKTEVTMAEGLKKPTKNLKQKTER